MHVQQYIKIKTQVWIIFVIISRLFGLVCDEGRSPLVGQKKYILLCSVKHLTSLK